MSLGEFEHEHLLDPKMPYRMAGRVEHALADADLLRAVGTTTALKDQERRQAFASSLGDNYQACKHQLARIKRHNLEFLGAYLRQFIAKAEQQGARVHFAADASQANGVCLRIAKDNASQLCVKSKSMLTEEVFLLRELERAGVETVETDLGEFIVQLDRDAPSHIVTPMIHKDRRTAGRALSRELGVEYCDDPKELTSIARQHLRAKFRSADLGISGANFLIAETGSVVVCTNEGNAGLTMTSPKVHVVFAGIEKLIPRRADLPPFLKLLARSATAQKLTVYTNIISGLRRQREHDGPEQLHIILIDNGRSQILATDRRELLACIRCGACLNACPVFSKVGGGHAYGAVYSGPIGAALTPLLRGLANYADLPQASSLCGACKDACPVDIDLPMHLIALRRDQVKAKVVRLRERCAYRVAHLCLRSPTLYRLGFAVLRLLGWRHAPRSGTFRAQWRQMQKAAHD